MTERLVIVGGGGFAREALDVVEALEDARPGSYEVVGVVDDAPSPAARGLLAERGVQIVGTIADWLADALPVAHDVYVVAIGSPGARHDIAARADAAGRRATTLVHPSATIGSRTVLGAGTIVCAGAALSTNVVVGRHGHVNPNATIGHDAVLGDAVSVNPAATVSGAVRVGDASLLGAASVVLQGLTVGAGALVGAAACVTRDVDAGAVVMGVPAR